MKLYQNGILQPEKSDTKHGKTSVAVTHTGEDFADFLCLIQKTKLPSIENNSTTKFESFNGWDYIGFDEPNFLNLEKHAGVVKIYHSQNMLLLVFSTAQQAEVFSSSLEKLFKTHTDVSTEFVIYNFLNRATKEDYKYLEKLEEDIAALEDMLLEKVEKDYSVLISKMRKQLLDLKRYYENLLALLYDLGENENKLYTSEQLHKFDLLEGRAERILRNVENLRDYVTQVREAYQNQVDISLNQTMKIFTVLTAIFSPLTLLVGWYGMNIAMPEFNWPYAHPFLIGLSLLIVVACIIFFKKRKWF